MRYNSSSIYNASLSSADIKKHLTLSPEAGKLLLTASERLQLTARSYFKIIKLAQTIADLEYAANMTSPTQITIPDIVIQTHHIAEALQYRPVLPG